MQRGTPPPGCALPEAAILWTCHKDADAALTVHVWESTDQAAPYPVVDRHIPAEEATRLLTRKTGAILVRENGKLSGIVTHYDVVRSMTGLGR